ncbi:hypothetical protein [Nocardiopsis sp. FR26]|uniref:hypothetical protein n=1 Tax=Nocardiopsis sp. FR26 TaxID=2605987 RepID=UPI001916945F|nr:hypothetical protein [Nocardiopsis sp. FR26]
MATQDVQITGLVGPGYQDTRITIGDTEVSAQALTGLTLRAEAGDTPRLTLDVLALDVTKVGGQMEILIPDETRALLVELGWTPPASE